jgi:hypothetical protein
MSITTKPKVNLEQLRARETELAQRVEDTRERLSQYSWLIAEARREAVYAGKARPGGELTGPVETLRKKERQDAAALPGLEGDLSAVRSVIEEESTRLALEKTAEVRKQLAELHEQEEAAWTKAGEVVAQLANHWNAYVDLVERESKLAQESGLDGSEALAVTPAPLSFKAWLLLLHRVATDPEVRAEPHVIAMTETGIYGNGHGGASYETRPAGTQTTEVRRRLDHADRLHRLIPDLRSVIHALSLSGRIPTSE